jgi:hypothetical protein
MSIVSTSFFNNLLPLLQQLHGFRTTFSNRFTFFATDSEFPATISLLLHRFIFFATNPEPCCNNCSNSCFLSDYSTTLWREGGPFREPSGLSIGTPRWRFSFSVLFWTAFQEPLFLQKIHFGSQKVLQNSSKIDSGSDLGSHFYIFQRTSILNDPPMILTYF